MPKSKEVDAWLARYENPMKDVVLRMREIILATDSRIEECIKWQAPTFTFRGNLAPSSRMMGFSFSSTLRTHSCGRPPSSNVL
jgi:uncharacterized protein YdhG (YjbR/CyaY superfamily)